MPLANLRNRTRALPVEPYTIDEFTVGLDASGRVSDASPKRFLQYRNMDIRTPRARARQGYVVSTGNPAGIKFTYGYYSTLHDAIIFVSEASKKVYKVADFYTTATWTDITGNLSTLIGGSGTWADTDIIDFNGALVFVHAGDTVNGEAKGVFTYNGTTWTTQSTTAGGGIVTSWQNKLWVADGNVLWFGGAGAFTFDVVNDWVALRDGGDAAAPITALHATKEMDQLGRPSLLVSKRQSLYRVNSPTTGAYSTLSRSVGAVTKRAIASSPLSTCFVSDTGIYATNGQAAPVRISEQVTPYVAFPVNVFPKVLAAFWDGIFRFSLQGWDPTVGTLNFLAPVVHLDWNETTGAWASHTLAAHTDSVSGTQTVIGYVPLAPGTISAAGNSNRWRLASWDNAASQNKFFMHDAYSGGQDDAGTANTSILQTPYLELAGGTRSRIQRLRVSVIPVTGATTLTLRVRRDGSTSDSVVRTATGLTANVLNTVDFNRLGDCRNVSFVFEWTTGANVVSGYRSDTRAHDTFELVRATVEHTPTGRN